jgi:hypothetical protein
MPALAAHPQLEATTLRLEAPRSGESDESQTLSRPSKASPLQYVLLAVIAGVVGYFVAYLLTSGT